MNETEVNNGNSEDSFGNYIKGLREKSFIKLETISENTKINLNILKNLEDEKTDQIPNYTYIKGFTDLYLTQVNASNNERETAFKLLKVLYKKPQKEIKIQTKNIPPKQSKKIQALDKLIPIKNFITDIRFLIALTIFVLSIPIYNFFFSLKDEVNIAQNKMEEITKTIKPILIKNLKAKDQDIFAIKSFKNFNLSDEVKKNKPSTNPIEKKEPEDKNEKDQKVSFNQIQGIPVDLIEDEELEDFKILPESVKDIDLDETNYVYIAAIDGDSWITYKADDQQVLTRTIKKDSSITIKGKNIFIYMGNNDVTKMFYNNQLVKRRNDQNVMSYVFPLEEAKNHFRPLFILSDAGSMVFYQKHPDFIEQSTTQTN